MPVSEEGYVTGSVDVSKLDDIDPKSDEAKEQVEALKQRRDEGQAQADADAARIAEAAAAQDNAEPVEDNRDVQGKPQADDDDESADEKPAEESKPAEQKPTEQKPAEQKPAAQPQQQAPGTVQPPQSTAGKKPDKG